MWLTKTGPMRWRQGRRVSDGAATDTAQITVTVTGVNDAPVANDDTWNASGLMPGASLLHPVLVRLRDDKSVSTEEIRFSQILERCFVEKASTSDSGGDLPDSKLLRREVYIKEAKGKTAVRKLLVWKTNKEKVSEEHPGFVVHWTDYSPDRKDPIKRTVRLASSKKTATSIADKLIEDNVKKGWALAEPT